MQLAHSRHPQPDVFLSRFSYRPGFGCPMLANLTCEKTTCCYLRQARFFSMCKQAMKIIRPAGTTCIPFPIKWLIPEAAKPSSETLGAFAISASVRQSNNLLIRQAINHYSVGTKVSVHGRTIELHISTPDMMRCLSVEYSLVFVFSPHRLLSCSSVRKNCGDFCERS